MGVEPQPDRLPFAVNRLLAAIPPSTLPLARFLPRLLGRMFRANTSQAALVTISVLVQSVAPPANALLLGLAVSKIDSGTFADSDLAMLLVGLSVLLFVMALAAFVQEALVPAMGRAVERDLRHDLMRACTASRAYAAGSPDLHDIVESASTLGTARFGPSIAVNTFPAIVINLLSGILMGGLIMAYRWWASLVLLGVWTASRSVRQKDNTQQLAVLLGPVPGGRRQAYIRGLGLTETGAREIRLFGLMKWVESAYHESWLESARARWRSLRSRAPVVASVSLLVVTVNAAVLLGIALSASHGQLSAARFIIAVQGLIGVASLADPGGVTAVDTLFVAANETIDRAERAIGVLGSLDSSGSSQDSPPLATDQRPIPTLSIATHHLTYVYAGATIPSISDLNLEIPTNQVTAIVGANGAGKSTLACLLAGALLPTSGDIVFPLSFERNSDRSRRRQVFLAAKDFVRLPGTIAENVLLGDENACFSELIDRARLSNVVARLPSGVSTYLTPAVRGGADLSGGEWQRVILARAMAAAQKGAKLLILDEPTAHLDVEAEAAVFEELVSLASGLTVVLVSHRLVTVRKAHRIYVLGEGRLVESGTHDELIAQGGLYAHMYQAQTGQDGLA